MAPKKIYIRKKKSPPPSDENALETTKEILASINQRSTTEYKTKTLVIVESPSKCKKITDFLGADKYKVVATRGHIYEIEGLSAIERSTFEPKYTVLSHQKETIKMLNHEILMAKEVLLATDDDREGEAIAYHVALQFGLSIENTPRIVFHEITRPAILHAVENPRRICMELVYAQQVRAILDIIVGFKVSPVLWRYIPKSADGSKKGSTDVLSAGRCQSVALRLIYENYLEGLEAAKDIGEPFYKIHGYFYSKNFQFELDNTIFSGKEEIRAFLEKSRNFQHMYLFEESQKTRVTNSAAPLPMNTSVLIQTCSNMLHISPHQTMQICQKLYQNGYITYMRTDSRKFAAPFIEDAKKYIVNRWGDNYLRADFSKITATGATAAGAPATTAAAKKPPAESHEAIRPTHINWSELSDDFEPRDRSVYALIRNYTLASCMADAKLESRTIHLSAPEEKVYKHPISRPIFAGWKIAVGDVDNNTAYLFFDSLAKKNAIVPYNSIKTAANIKYSHSHYSEASLVKKLEEKGIGRPSTFSSLIEVIQKRDYVKRTEVEGIKVLCSEYLLEKDAPQIKTTTVEKVFGHENKKLVIQPVGITAIEFLLKHFQDFFNYEYTAKMELELDIIAANGCPSTKKKLCSDCHKTLSQVIKNIKQKNDKEYKIDENHVLTFTYRGPVIKYLDPATAATADTTAAPKYKNIKSGMDINIEKLERGEYKLEDLLEIKNDCLGMYEGEPMYIKLGKYGVYAEWGTNRTSLKKLGKAPNDITMDDIVDFLKNGTSHMSVNVIKSFTSDISIRKGRYGPYIFYQTPDMESPTFISIPKKYVKDITAYSPENMQNYVAERLQSKSKKGGGATEAETNEKSD